MTVCLRRVVTFHNEQSTSVSHLPTPNVLRQAGFLGYTVIIHSEIKT